MLINENTNVQHNFYSTTTSYLDRGWSVIPVWGALQPAHFKVAAVQWKRYSRQHPTQDQISYWFKYGSFQGTGIITGRLSRLGVLDFDCLNKYKLFCELFPHLIITYIVKTPRGWHLYFEIPPECTTKNLKSAGIDWQWEGRYVVAPPTAGYSIQNAQNPRILNQQDILAIERFFDAQTPDFTRYEPEATSITQRELQACYSKQAFKGNRNNALFQTGLLARDHGWSLQDTIEMLSSLHINNRHNHESVDARQRETLATLKSVFSRLARRLEDIHQLPNTIRERLMDLKQTRIVRVIEALRLKGYEPGSYVSSQEAWEVLDGYVGRDSIIQAFQARNKRNQPIFETISSYKKPAMNISKDIDHNCLMVTNSKSGKSRKMGRPTDFYRMPSNAELAQILNVRLSSISDTLTLDDLKSAKTTRQVLHYRFIERRPGKYSTKWLSKRIGISKVTKNRYERELTNLHKRPTHTIKPIYWNTLDEISEEYDVPGQFLEDEQGQRYPAKRVIAIKLLKQNLKVRLMTRGFNYYWVGNRFEADTSALVTVIVNNHKLPEPDFGLLPKKGGSVDITVFAPPSMFFDAQTGINERMKTIKNTMAVQFKDDDKPRIFKIEKITVHPEGLGAVGAFALDNQGQAVDGQ